MTRCISSLSLISTGDRATGVGALAIADKMLERAGVDEVSSRERFCAGLSACATGDVRTLPALLAAAVAAHAEREALISTRGRLTYAALAARVEQAAGALAARGVGRGTRVGLLLPNWPEWAVLAFAVWRCGGVLVPLATVAPPRDLAATLARGDVALAVGVRRFRRYAYEEGLAAAPAHVLLEEPPPGAALDLGPLLAAGAGDPGGPPDPSAEATLCFTSGSTAEPKGVVHTQAGLALAARGDAAVLGVGPEDRTWGQLPFFFAGGLVAVLLATLSAGGAVVLQEVFEPGEGLALLERERVTVFFSWPHQAEALLAHPDFAHRRLVVHKGVGANTAWAERLYPPAHLAVSAYGMTETPPLCAAWPWHASLERRRGSYGPPVGERELRIVDPATGAACAAGAEGEICVRGPELFSHYLGRTPAECRDADGFFHTGDRGHLDADGALHFAGRLGDVIRSAGANVSAAEVEAALREHPAVSAAHVVGVPDPRRGESVAAFVVAAAAVDAETLVAHCRTRLASWKVPRHLWLREEGGLPTRGSGKVDRVALHAEAVRLVAEADPPG